MSWIIGVVIAVCSAIINSLGVILQKKSHILNSIKEKSQQKTYLLQPLWVAGFSMYLLGNAGMAVALSFASQSIVTPMSSVSLAGNAVFAPIILKEQIGWMDIFATSLIVIGAVLTALFGNHEDTSHTLAELFELYANPAFIAYATIVAALLLFDYLFVKFWVLPKVASLSGNKEEPPAQQLPMVPLSENSVTPSGDQPQEGTSGENEKLSAQDKTRSMAMWKNFVAVSYSSLSGGISSINVLMVKSCGELISTSSAGNNQFTNVYAYFPFLVLVFSVTSEIYWMQKALQSFDALIVVPVFQVLYSLLSIINGLIYFKEFSTFSLTQMIVFPIGVVLTLVGVFLLSRREIKQMPLKKKIKTVKTAVAVLRAWGENHAHFHHHQDEPNNPTSPPQSARGVADTVMAMTFPVACQAVRAATRHGRRPAPEPLQVLDMTNDLERAASKSAVVV